MIDRATEKNSVNLLSLIGYFMRKRRLQRSVKLQPMFYISAKNSEKRDLVRIRI